MLKLTIIKWIKFLRPAAFFRCIFNQAQAVRLLLHSR